ncbi:hypothetical protein JCM11641_007288 [Rhodosporidiobolus odoratus]
MVRSTLSTAFVPRSPLAVSRLPAPHHLHPRALQSVRHLVHHRLLLSIGSAQRHAQQGVSFSSLFNKLSGLFSRQTEVRILMLGLDSAGKTTILYRLQIGEVVTTIPTIGFNVETVQYKNIKFQVWDLGGQTSIRPYWRCYYADTKAVVYVVDSSDRERLGINKAELLAMLNEEELQGAKLLVFANKQDQPDAMTPAEVSEGLGLDTLKNRQWSIFKACAIKGEGLEEGLDWLATALANK